MKYLNKLKRFSFIEPLFYLNKKESVKEYRRIRKEFEKIGISGIKPTEQRIKNYEISKLFNKNKTVLDIGSNSGFIVCYLAEIFREVDGIELYPFLVKMSEATKDFLDLNNVNFIQEDFVKCELNKKYDVVLSLSNHNTVDGNLKLGFESYTKKIFKHLKKDGILLFESHDIHGGDADLEEKFKTASKYFELIDSKMVKSFAKADIDKLFEVFKKLEEVGEVKKSDFSLQKTKKRYHYTNPIIC